MTEEENRSDIAEAASLYAPGKIALQLVGFAIGIALLVWIIRNAIEEGDWQRLAGAGPGLIAALVGFTMVSVFANASTFWITIRPVKHIGFWDLQRLNVFANLLNYAPVRLGAIGRVLYHLRVDRLSLLQIGAWFAVVGYMFMLVVAAAGMATIAQDRVNTVWWLLVAGQLVLGGFAFRAMVHLPVLARYGQGIDSIARDGTSLWGGIGLRLVDLGAFTGRMAAAAAILEIELTVSHVIALAIVAQVASLIPFGRLGFREFCVAVAAGRLQMVAGDVQANMNQLALVESAGEAIVFVPLGLTSLWWFQRRWRAAGSANPPVG